MKKIRAYNLNPRKMVRIGDKGYLPGQEQAKEDVYFDGHVGQNCRVEVFDTALKHELLELCSIQGADRTRPVILHVDIFDEGKSFLTLYYAGLFGNPMSRNIGNFVAGASDYSLCQHIIQRLVQAQKED